MKTLLVDMDSVICDLMTEWHRRYNRDYDDDLTPDRLLCWHSERYVKPACGAKIYDYLDEPGLFAGLAPIAGAVECLRRIADMHEVLIVTNSRPGAFVEKQGWVAEHLPFIPKANLIFAQRKEMIRGDLLFDDAPQNLEAFRSTGRLAVAMDYAYNRAVPVPRVRNWMEFEALIRGLWGGDSA